ncbi:dynamin family protein [Albidovulum inexpectatum]|uniref:Dynamin family protein n=1 Tax=Albidovulum inexpectatum TaxID=196587 RepID=A0A2S5JM81_9RHOB|nr:dynamin family protein [Albidovulum inexpectatum]PPB82599.1 dynamin family protein [Albidovulum inexpectatum]
MVKEDVIRPRPPRTVDPDKLERLRQWSRRKPVIALMGEFSSGKSTLLNLLVGQDMMPVKVTATHLPPVWLRYGSAEPYRIDRKGRRHPVDLNRLSDVPVEDTRVIRVFSQADILGRCDLIDMPGISDPNLAAQDHLDILAAASGVIWCTHAAQAWRESERAMWAEMPARLRQNSILLVTRADKLRSEEDVAKIEARLARETNGLFAARIFASLKTALAAQRADNPLAWEASGAAELVTTLESILRRVSRRREQLLSRYLAENGTADPQLAEGGAIAVEDNADASDPAAGTVSTPLSPDQDAARRALLSDLRDVLSHHAAALGSVTLADLASLLAELDR